MTEPVYVAAVARLFARPARPLTGRISVRGGVQADGVVVQWAADAEGGILQNVGFRVWACPHIIALCHAVAERLEGVAVETAAAGLAGRFSAAAKELDIPAEKAGKILIIKDTLLELLAGARAPFDDQADPSNALRGRPRGT